MVILGAGLNHWYHMDMSYRGIISLLVMCGCVGKSGGGWSHYVGQEKLRPQTGWLPLAFALDWSRPPRQMNGTSFFYAHTDQWRYETLRMSEILSPLAPEGDWSGSMIDYNAKAERMGWLPSAPQLDTNPIELGRHIHETGTDPASVLVDGINGGADLRNTGRITQKGLDFYLADEVPKLTRGLQTPLTIIPFGTPDFPIFERVKTAAESG